MSDSSKTPLLTPQKQDGAKPGFFKRIVSKLDGVMKEKAEEKAREGGCCGGDGKDGKCC